METVATRPCAKCGKPKHYDGKQWRCRPCLTASQASWRKNLSAERRAALVEVENANRAVRRAARSPEKRASDIAAVQRWREANPQRYREGTRRWYQTNAEYARAAKLAEYYREPEAFHARNQVRKARLANAICEHGAGCVDEAFLAKLYASVCRYCGAPAEDADHYIPLSRGGLHCRENLVPACAPCNGSKFNHDPVEWLASRL